MLAHISLYLLLPGNIIQSLGGADAPEATQRLLKGIMVVTGVDEDMTVDSLKKVFPDSSDIIIPHQKPGKRYVMIIMLPQKGHF